MEHNSHLFFALLRTAMTGETFESVPSAKDWADLYRIASQQSVLGLCYTTFSQLSQEQLPPMKLMIQWISEGEKIRRMNEQQNQEAARLTQLFSEQGRKTAILKGQANARLYQDPYSRQPGDIDIWVEGGGDSVMALLMKMGLVEEKANNPGKGKADTSSHHIDLPPTKDQINVEVHFRPSSGNFNPFTNRRLQHWLDEEIKKPTGVTTADGWEFFVPSVRFALVMQLSHIQRHFLAVGIGMRHICDYFWLIKNATEEDRQAMAAMSKAFGLRHTAEALMWVLAEVLHLEEEKLYCEKDPYRGKRMLQEIMEGGNFGKYSERQQHGTLRKVIETRWHHLQLMRFDFWEMLWLELNFWKKGTKMLWKIIAKR